MWIVVCQEDYDIWMVECDTYEKAKKLYDEENEVSYLNQYLYLAEVKEGKIIKGDRYE